MYVADACCRQAFCMASRCTKVISLVDRNGGVVRLQLVPEKLSHFDDVVVPDVTHVFDLTPL